MKNIQKMFAISTLVALASQVNLELLESEFVVSAGVILYVIFLYHYDDINPIPFGLLSGGMVFILRLTVYQVIYGSAVEVASSYMPEIVFYAAYAVFFLLFLENNRKNNLGFIFIVFIISDFASNLIEVFVRFTVLTETTILEVIPTLIIVSVIRSSVVWIVLTSLKYYNMMLTKREHEDRYKRLLLFTSQLKTEMFWIEKNRDNIENVIAQSYDLYEKIRAKQDDDLEDIALSIARDINEIKKDNGFVFRGIKDITEKELKDKGMEYKDINNILSETMIRETKRCNKNIKFDFNIGENFYTSKHYYLISVLRNLIMNSMDSIRKAQKDSKISILHQDNENLHVFKVSDNGAGIDEEFLRQIFSPGFSTKVNSETGEVNRGLGLSIVKYIVEEHLNGEIKVSSKTGVGTTTIISIPKVSLES